MTKIFIYLIPFFIFQTYSQQAINFTLLPNNNSLYSPASSGVFYKQFITLGNKIDKFQNNNYGIYDVKLSKIKSGIGINFLYNKSNEGISNRINFNYAYHLSINKNTLSLGASFGYINMKLNSNMNTITKIFPNDPTIKNYHDYDINVGLLFKTPKYYIGFSTYNLKESVFPKVIREKKSEYFTTFSYNTNVNENVEIIPYLNISLDNDLILENVNFNVILKYKGKLTAGLNLQKYYNCGLILGYCYKEKIRFNYSINRFVMNNWGYSHEFGLSFSYN